eukprot:COSAG06_NODE_647_length_13449_cov_738.445210_2_plen_188_part_00
MTLPLYHRQRGKSTIPTTKSPADIDRWYRRLGAPEPPGGEPAVAWSVEPFPGSSAQVKAEPASYSAMSVLDVVSFKQRAAVDFLSTADVVAVLANVERESTPISTQPVRDPPSGTLVFYNKKNTKRFRDDGYQWRKIADGCVKESKTSLKIGGVVVLTGMYARLALWRGGSGNTRTKAGACGAAPKA